MKYLCILFLITFYHQGFFRFLITAVIQQLDEVVIGVSFCMCMHNFVLRNKTRLLGK